MNRREFTTVLGGAGAAWPLVAHAQQAGKVYRIGILETIPASQNTANLDALRNGLRALGYIEGQNLAIDYSSADGIAERFPELAGELVHLNVDLIITRGTPAAQAAKNATTTIPVVMAAIGEPLGTGIVAGLGRPSGNVTGLSSFTTELAGKRVELVKEMLPGVSRIGLLQNMGNPVVPPQWDETLASARMLGLTAELLDVRNEQDISAAFEAALRLRIGALLIGIDGFIQSNSQAIVGWAARHRVPAVYPSKEFADAGGLMTYGISYPDLYFRAASFVDRIFKGTKPGDLPIQAPTKFELVINLKTAKALGLAMPPTLFSGRRGDRVMKRREFITLLGGAAATWPLVARGQQALPVIGFLRTGTFADVPKRMSAFYQGLKEVGFVEGRNVAIEYRSDEGQTNRLPLLVADLLSLQVALFVGNTPSALAAKAATTMVPIVFTTGGDPVRDGLVPSLNRPGGNVTGVSFMSTLIGTKQLGLLRELLPGAAHVAVLADPNWPLTERYISEVRAAASAIGTQIEVLDVSSDREIEAAFPTLVQLGADALLCGVGGFLLSKQDRIVALAARHKIPTIYVFGEAVAAGGLMSYAPSFADAFRQAGIYAGRIIKGEKRGDLPVVLPTKFEFLINLRTAKALGLEIPDKLLALADEVME